MGPRPPLEPVRALLNGVLRPVVQIQTYRNAAYILLAFPLGLFYSILLGLGLMFGIGLSLVLV